MKVWVAERGIYSDRYVVGVFSTTEEARKHGDDATEYEVDALVGKFRRSVFIALVYLDNGEAADLDSGLSSQPIGEEETETLLWTPSKEGEPNPFYTPGSGAQRTLRGFVVVRSPVDYEHALKVATEKRQEWLRSKVDPAAQVGGGD